MLDLLRRITMTRYVTIYALDNDKTDIFKVMETLNGLKPLLPLGMTMRMFGTEAPEMKALEMPPWVFGEVAQFIDLEDGITIDDFRRSKAYETQKSLTRGLITNETTVSYNFDK
jgi:hypothetical protein